MITVFTSCYNQAEFLTQAIESVLNQTYTDFEYLLYDDGSTDNTWEIMREFSLKDSRIKARRLDKQKNIAVVLNRSVRDSVGDTWVWCPSDDYFHKDLLQSKFDCKNYRGKIIFSNWTNVDGEGKLLDTFIVPNLSKERFLEQVLRETHIGFTGIWIPKWVFKKVGPFPEKLDFCEDYYWLVKAAIHGIHFVGVPGVLFCKRIHNNRNEYRNYDAVVAQVPVLKAELLAYRDQMRGK